MIAEEELDGIDIVDIANFVGLLRLAFTNEECGNIKVFVDGGELAGNINQKNTSDVLKTYRCSLCDKCWRRECFFNKHLEYCESVR